MVPLWWFALECLSWYRVRRFVGWVLLACPCLRDLRCRLILLQRNRCLFRVLVYFCRVLDRIREVLVQWCTSCGLCRRNRLVPKVFYLQGSGRECILVDVCRIRSTLLGLESFCKPLFL